MGLKRRQFLWMGGAVLGTGTGLVARAFRQPSVPKLTASASVIGEGPAPPSLHPNISANPAPAGLYAPKRGDVRIGVISDLNSSYGSTTYRTEVAEGMKMLPAWEPDLVVCAGDMVAGQSLNLSRSEIQSMWAAFDQRIFSPIRQADLPFAFTLGNHDASSYRDFDGHFVYALDREVSRAFWTHPQRQLGLQLMDRTKFPFYYSFESNQIFFLVWDASSARISPEQVSWAEQSLASDRAQQAKMRIVIGHLPFYAVSQGRDRAGEILERADQLRLLLERYNVHTYICGHHHAYFPGRVGQLEMLHCGALGSGPRSWLDTTAAAMQTLTIVDIDLASQATTYTTYNMSTLEVVQANQLPRVLVGPNGKVVRSDIAWADLTPEERNRQHVLSK